MEIHTLTFTPTCTDHIPQDDNSPTVGRGESLAHAYLDLIKNLIERYGNISVELILSDMGDMMSGFVHESEEIFEWRDMGEPENNFNVEYKIEENE